MTHSARGKTSRTTEPSRDSQLEVVAATPDRWGDLERLFGKSGAYSGCWCMYWRISSAEFAANGNAGNREALHHLTESGVVPGLLGYRGAEPVGWISLAPRKEFGRLERSPRLKPVDDEPVWAIVCFFVHRQHRRTGVAEGLLEAAIGYAAARGARHLEAFPFGGDPGTLSAAAAYMGTLPLFTRAGFREIARRSPKRPILRRSL